MEAEEGLKVWSTGYEKGSATSPRWNFICRTKSFYETWSWYEINFGERKNLSGCVGTIIIGDFRKLSPGPSKSLFTALLKVSFHAASLNQNDTSAGPAIQSTWLFGNFQQIKRSQRIGAVRDPDHINFLNKCWSISNDPQTRSMETIDRIKVNTKVDHKQE